MYVYVYFVQAGGLIYIPVGTPFTYIYHLYMYKAR